MIQANIFSLFLPSSVFSCVHIIWFRLRFDNHYYYHYTFMYSLFPFTRWWRGEKRVKKHYKWLPHQETFWFVCDFVFNLFSFLFGFSTFVFSHWLNIPYTDCSVVYICSLKRLKNSKTILRIICFSKKYSSYLLLLNQICFINCRPTGTSDKLLPRKKQAFHLLISVRFHSPLL